MRRREWLAWFNRIEVALYVVIWAVAVAATILILGRAVS